MKALVTGGGGFLGRRIVELLVERGDDVRFLARGSYPEVEALGAVGMQADLRNPGELVEAVDGIDTIFHVAAKAGAWGPREEYWSINVDGTRNLLDAAEKAGVKIVGQYWTIGSHDGVLIMEAETEEKAASVLLHLGASGNVRTTTLRAFDWAEAQDLIDAE